MTSSLSVSQTYQSIRTSFGWKIQSATRKGECKQYPTINRNLPVRKTGFVNEIPWKCRDEPSLIRKQFGWFEIESRKCHLLKILMCKFVAQNVRKMFENAIQILRYTMSFQYPFHSLHTSGTFSSKSHCMEHNSRASKRFVASSIQLRNNFTAKHAYAL